MLRKLALRIQVSRVSAAWHILRGHKVVSGLGRLDIVQDIAGWRVYDTTLVLQIDAAKLLRKDGLTVADSRFYGRHPAVALPLAEELT